MADQADRVAGGVGDVVVRTRVGAVRGRRVEQPAAVRLDRGGEPTSTSSTATHASRPASGGRGSVGDELADDARAPRAPACWGRSASPGRRRRTGRTPRGPWWAPAGSRPDRGRRSWFLLVGQQAEHTLRPPGLVPFRWSAAPAGEPDEEHRVHQLPTPTRWRRPRSPRAARVSRATRPSTSQRAVRPGAAPGRRPVAPRSGHPPPPRRPRAEHRPNVWRPADGRRTRRGRGAVGSRARDRPVAAQDGDRSSSPAIATSMTA